MTDKFEENIDSKTENLPACDVLDQKEDGTDEYVTLPFDYFLEIFKGFQYVNMYE